MSRIEVRQITNDAYVTLQGNSDHPGLNDELQFPVKNVSTGGIRIESSEEFKIGEQVEVALYLNGELSHSAKGRICYCDDKSSSPQVFYGVSFLDKFIQLHH